MGGAIYKGRTVDGNLSSNLEWPKTRELLNMYVLYMFVVVRK